MLCMALAHTYLNTRDEIAQRLQEGRIGVGNGSHQAAASQCQQHAQHFNARTARACASGAFFKAFEEPSPAVVHFTQDFDVNTDYFLPGSHLPTCVPEGMPADSHLLMFCPIKLAMNYLRASRWCGQN